ncbi:MAG: hypothetical protein Q4D27_02020 [Coriobacteriia bacterium]|nr:hypothetical protein [Coriobacteriia bacterium]
MIDGTYQISLRLPAAHHDGAVVLSTSGNAVDANFIIDGIGGLRTKGTHDGDSFLLRGAVNLYQFGRVTYRIDGLVAGDVLKATCTTDRGTFDVAGTRKER